MVLLILVSPVLPCKWGRLVELSGKCALGLLSLFAIYTANGKFNAQFIFCTAVIVEKLHYT